MAEAARKQPPLMTTEEFLAWPGDGTGTIYELVDGVPRAMAPPSQTQGTIQANLIIHAGNHLLTARPNYRVVANPGIQPKVRANCNLRMAELGVTCARNERGVQMIPDPILLFEVLSPWNAADTWSNIPLYVTLPSVQEILIVHSTAIRAELLRRGTDGVWPDNPDAIAGKRASIHLASIELDLPMTALYRGTYLLG